MRLHVSTVANPVRLCACVIACLCLRPLAADEATYDLSVAIPESPARSVEAVLEVQGELKLNADGSEVTRLPMQAEGKLAYEERLVGDGQASPSGRSVRYYTTAEANIRLGEGGFQPKLDGDHRLIVARSDDGRVTFTCPDQILAREEIELLEIPGDSLLINCILPTSPVNIGSEWEIDEHRLAGMLDLDVITEAAVVCKLKSVTNDTALIEAAGNVSGAVNGVASTISLQAKANYDLKKKMLTWFAVALKEKREIGHAEPGFEVTARLRLSASPIAAPTHLSDERLASLRMEDAADLELLESRSEEGHFRVMLDRRWHVMSHRFDVSVLRFVDGGDLIAQCNISPLPDLEAGRELSLEEFQADVRRALGDRLSQIVEASQSTTGDKKRVLRVVASGIVSDVPIHWIYYHATNEDGRRAAIAFTLEADLVERFAESDQTVIETLRFLPRPETAPRQPETAEEAADATSQLR